MTLLSTDDHLNNLCQMIDHVEDECSCNNRDQTVKEHQMVYFAAKELCNMFELTGYSTTNHYYKTGNTIVSSDLQKTFEYMNAMQDEDEDEGVKFMGADDFWKDK